MTQTHTGLMLAIAAIVMMLGLMAREVSEPALIGKMMGHLSVVGVAFIGGKLLPAPEGKQ